MGFFKNIYTTYYYNFLLDMEKDGGRKNDDGRPEGEGEGEGRKHRKKVN